MRKSSYYLSSLLILFAALSSVAAAGNIGTLGIQNKGKSIAIVSVSANNYGGSLQGWNSANSSDLMGGQLNKMVGMIETLFSKDWTVVSASTFAGKDEFQLLAGERREVGLPAFDGKTMPLFSKDRKQLIKAEVDKDVAIKLAQITGADYILIAYSEWAVATGRFIPTSKALAKNVVSIYDAQGKKVYEDRSDAQGDKTLGAMGSVVVDQSSIGEWVNAYDKGIHTLYGAPRD
ncbi:MAG: hypothetical protein ABI821_09105 [Pseudomonadota bacterium]